jgi:phosphate acyltransferase
LRAHPAPTCAHDPRIGYSRRVRVVVDAMGSDRAPSPEVAGALRAVAADPTLEVTLVGDSARLSAALGSAATAATAAARITLVSATEVVTMHDHPGQAFRQKPDSSMRIAVDRVAANQGDAVVSAGNSGAMLATSLFVLGRLAGVERPAIVTVLPTPSGPLVLCDAGANVEPKAAQLAQFGVLGAAYDRAVHGRSRPRLGLLSNGAEPGKGNALTREAHALLANAKGAFQYIGYVEGSDLFRGVVDVIATDGFTGNVVLKTLEGGMRTLVSAIFEAFGSTPETTAASEVLIPALLPLYGTLDPDNTGGAMLLGVDGLCLISHGSSSATAIVNAVRVAKELHDHAIVDRLRAAVAPV